MASPSAADTAQDSAASLEPTDDRHLQLAKAFVLCNQIADNWQSMVEMYDGNKAYDDFLASIIVMVCDRATTADTPKILNLYVAHNSIHDRLVQLHEFMSTINEAWRLMREALSSLKDIILQRLTHATSITWNTLVDPILEKIAQGYQKYEHAQKIYGQEEEKVDQICREVEQAADDLETLIKQWQPDDQAMDELAALFAQFEAVFKQSEDNEISREVERHLKTE